MKRRDYLKKLFVFIFLILIFLSSGCTAKDGMEKNEIRIAEQYGIAYAPITIMKDQKILEKKIPNVHIVWDQMINTTAIREAMIADKLDVGFMAIPPFFIGWDKGMDWKIATGLSSVPNGLVTRTDITSLKDITSDVRIALPQPGSVQHILLSMASEREFNDPKKFDNLLVTLSHPDGMNALLSGKEIKAHFTSTPYLQNELKNKTFHQILDGKESFGGDFSFIVGVTTNTFHDKNPELYEAFTASVSESIDFLNNKPEEAAVILARYYDIPEEEIFKYITADDTTYSAKVKGTKRFGDFMEKTGYISKSYENIDEIMWEKEYYEE